MDKEYKKRVIDYWDPDQLVAFLGVSIEEVVDAFDYKLEELEEEIREFMEYGR
jgi:hypothetical protein